MTIPKKIIELAIESGWRKGTDFDLTFVAQGFIEYIPKGLRANDDELSERVTIVIEEIALDPFFWQALTPDKLVNCWACNGLKYFTKFATDEIDMNEPCGNCEQKGTEIKSEWKNVAVNFYNLVLTGGDTEKFWDDLLKDNK